MIEKMNKLTCLVHNADYDRFLASLQQLGILHVHVTTHETPDPESPLIRQMQKANHLHQCITQLKSLTSQETSITNTIPKINPEDLIKLIDDINLNIQQYQTRLQQCIKDRDALLPWGNFKPQDTEFLIDVGLVIHFFICPIRNFNSQWIGQYNAIEIASDNKDKIYFITLTSPDTVIDIVAEQPHLPHTSLAEVEEQITTCREELIKLNNQLSQISAENLSALVKHLASLRTDIIRQQVHLQTPSVAEGHVMVLTGWIPEKQTFALTNFLEQNDICYQIDKPTPNDNPPVKLVNNPFVRMYETLTRMYGTPLYNEFDPTPLVAPFFTLFFGFCMADAGYGLILIALAIVAKRKLPHTTYGILNLVITLGIATTIMGAFLGTFFGINLTNVTLPQSIKNMMIVGKVSGTPYDKQMLLALLIGVLHLLIAMFIKALGRTIRLGLYSAVSAWSWFLFFFMTVVTFSLQYLHIISLNNAICVFVIIASLSAIGIFILNNLHRNILINIGAGLWDTYNMATGILGDLLSYIRLYALGLAGAMLGGVFNQLALMARDAAYTPIDGAIYCGLILIVGHSLNIAMSCLSAFVHPLRLTFVEYFKNSEYQGKGQSYSPFTIVSDESEN